MKKCKTFPRVPVALVATLLVASLFQVGVVRADRAKIIASVSTPSENGVWEAVDLIADSMKFGDMARGFRDLANARFPFLEKVAKTKQIGFAVATDGDDVFPFAFVPLKNEGSLESSEVAELEKKAKELTKLDDISLFVANSTLFATQAKFKDSIPTSVDDFEQIKPNENEKILLNADVDLAAIPEELLEAGFAAFRQSASQNLSDLDALERERLESVLTFYSKIVASLKRIAVKVSVDPEANFVVESSVECKEDGDLAPLFKANNDVKTRWSSFADSSNSILVSISAGNQQFELFKNFRVEQIQNVVSRNLLDQLDSLLDDPEDFEIAKRLVKLYEKMLISVAESDSEDVGFAVESEPFLVKFGIAFSSPDDLREALKILVERMKRDFENLDKFVALDAEEIEGFSVSKLDLPVVELTPSPISYFKDKSLTARLGVGKNATVLVFGLTPSDVDAAFVQILNASKETNPLPQADFFDFAPLARFLGVVFEDAGNLQLRPALKRALDKIGAAENAKMTTQGNCVENVASIKFTVQNGVFKALGDSIRLALASGGQDEEEVDLDDAFDEE
ncbi:MAG: hypothetical protein IJM30_08930 [Thermoguttaceae bacterium]|nr:hypothetical protein [Thermoguttaceae bacterium]